MSVDGDRNGRNIEAELESPAAGHFGIPVDAKCVGCRRVRIKRATLEDLEQVPHVDPTTLETSDLTSFKHVCHSCKGATWWYPVAVLTGLLESEQGE